MDFVRHLGTQDASSRERLTKLEAEEKDISAQRREIQQRLDALRAKTARDDA